jgi:hypothetical protein
MAAAVARQYPGYPSWTIGRHEASFAEAFPDDVKDRMVYLTADATTELTVLEPDHAYIIGGIVDRNRYKSLCLDRARELGIKTARLPIGDHLKMAGSKVLSPTLYLTTSRAELAAVAIWTLLEQFRHKSEVCSIPEHMIALRNVSIWLAAASPTRLAC